MFGTKVYYIATEFIPNVYIIETNISCNRTPYHRIRHNSICNSLINQAAAICVAFVSVQFLELYRSVLFCYTFFLPLFSLQVVFLLTFSALARKIHSLRHVENLN